MEELKDNKYELGKDIIDENGKLHHFICEYYDKLENKHSK